MPRVAVFIDGAYLEFVLKAEYRARKKAVFPLERSLIDQDFIEAIRYH